MPLLIFHQSLVIYFGIPFCTGWEVSISLRIYRSNYNIDFSTLPISSAFRSLQTSINEISIGNYHADNPCHIRKKRIISTIVRYSNLRLLLGEGIRRTSLRKFSIVISYNANVNGFSLKYA